MNFALILFSALAITGTIWLLDHLFLAKRRAAEAKLPLLVEYSKSFFPVILIVFLLRSFLVEPFKIPSGSMLPTLLVGDFILVNKYQYGIRLPVLNKKMVQLGDPQPGDVMVFRYPRDPSLDYIKRVVGTPGDRVEYRDKRLIINGKPADMAPNGQYEYTASGFNIVQGDTWREQLGAHNHIAMTQRDMPPVMVHQVEGDFPFRDHCSYSETGFKCVVPAGYYFMMGDNRDASNDSRYWGFVPDANIVGRAFFIWWNFDDFLNSLKSFTKPARIGHRIE
ncbi:MAG: signal peptidase I [Hydrogenophilales bacterium CG_4_9_14_3_um_filter_63_34]|nr:MAG: signal peptidase I [Hydrogenophilales bacterium CG_4_10_14_3_um_filter_63_21]PJB04086.1 MAG: signal peptidase I [Hydrogenophilales bacterium CG_4_9_14_3_um_filter_63_34]